ncbi:MAG: hypothetical protein JNM85_05355 [Chthonomonas sp.]|nr:hypothetical protein [Chthonomonas sp.]
MGRRGPSQATALPQETHTLIVCNLTKPESTLDQVKKTFPKLPQTDAALVATALVLSGRYAKVEHDGDTFDWTKDYHELTSRLLPILEQVNLGIEPPAKRTKAAIAASEEEIVEFKINLVSNYAQGETVLGEREDLKTLLAEILQSGVEYQYSSTDIGWQWALDRANWSTLSGGDLTRRVKLKALFSGDNVGTEMGQNGPKKRASKRAAAAVVEVEIPEVAPEGAIVEEEA